jgi:uncharacterized membrane protein
MYLKIYFLSLLAFLVLDFFWLGYIAKDFYQNEIGSIISSQIRWWAAAVFYLLFIFGLVHFVIYPNIMNPNLVQMLLNAALFGLVCYATYDLTNYATIKAFTLKVVLYDLLWGSFVSVATAFITYGLILGFKK